MGSSNHKLSFLHSYLHFFRQITEEFGDANHTQDNWGVVINAKPRKNRRIFVRVKLAENRGGWFYSYARCSLAKHNKQNPRVKIR